jgi:hypothetical protein
MGLSIQHKDPQRLPRSFRVLPSRGNVVCTELACCQRCIDGWHGIRDVFCVIQQPQTSTSKVVSPRSAWHLRLPALVPAQAAALMNLLCTQW